MLDWLAERWNDFVDFLYSLVLSVGAMLKDLFFWIFENICELLVYILDGLGTMFEGLDIVQYITALPPDVAAILSAVGIGEATGIIITSILIRLLLQLIPFTRLGS